MFQETYSDMISIDDLCEMLTMEKILLTIY